MNETYSYYFEIVIENIEHILLIAFNLESLPLAVSYYGIFIFRYLPI